MGTYVLTAEPILRKSGLSRRAFKTITGASTKDVYGNLDKPISIRKADAWCVSLSMHPCEVYGPVWYTLCA